MLNILLLMSFSYFAVTDSFPYTHPKEDYIEIIEVFNEEDTLIYRASALSENMVLYTKTWKNVSVIMADSTYDSDLGQLKFFQMNLDSTSGRLPVGGTGFHRSGKKVITKKLLRDVYSVSWLTPSKSKIKRSKTVYIVPVDRVDNDFYPIVLDLQKWLRSKW